MHKEIRRVDPDRGIIQVTTLDERFYGRMHPNAAGIDEFTWRPSVTWMCEYYPKGIGFQTWLKKNGDDSDLIARLAADRGYKVHDVVAKLNERIPEGLGVQLISGPGAPAEKFPNPSTGQDEELSSEEVCGVLSYVDWWNKEGSKFFKIIACEFTTWPDEKECADRTNYPARVFRFAGTVDLKVEQIVEGEVIRKSGYKGWKGEIGTFGIIDLKTSLDIWPAHEMQVSAYRVAENADWAAILQLNYRRNKLKKFKFTEIPDKFALFCSTQRIWENETDGIEPLQRDYPLYVKLGQDVQVP